MLSIICNFINSLKKTLLCDAQRVNCPSFYGVSIDFVAINFEVIKFSWIKFNRFCLNFIDFG